MLFYCPNSLLVRSETKDDIKVNGLVLMVFILSVCHELDPIMPYIIF